MVTHEMLREFQNNLPFLRNVVIEYEDRFANSGAKIGDTLSIRRQNAFEAASGAVISSMQDATDRTVPLVVDQQFHVPMAFTSAELGLKVDRFKERYIAPAARALANKVEAYALDKAYKSVSNTVGTPGTIPNTIKTYLSAGQKMDESAAPVDGMRNLIITPGMQTEIVDALKGLFQSSEQIKKQYVSGRMGTAAGFDWMMSQVARTHTVGPLGGTPLVNGASQTGATLVTDGWTASAASRLKKGDVFTIAGVYALNPLTFDSTGALRQFTVTADVSSDGSGNASIPISPSITTTGAYRNVSGSPADNAALTILGAGNTVTPVGLAWHKQAFAFAAPALPNVKEDGASCYRSIDKQTGISLRITRQYDITNDRVICRVDVLCGFATLNQDFACRIQS